MLSQFEQFNLHPALLRGLEAIGFTSPTPVQQHAIPAILDGHDTLVQAKTGSGKTLAFGLPLLSLIELDKRPQALVLLPTRELALQVCDALEPLNAQLGLRIAPIFGGVGIKPQEDQLKKGVDIIVGTPGRLRDLLNRGSLDLGAIRVLVLDEADQMLDMGFLPEMEFFIQRLPSREQTLLFSATMPAPIETIARRYMKQPELIKLTAAEVTPTEIAHYYVRVEHTQRLDALVALMEQEQPERGIIFVRTRHETKRLAVKLDKLAGIQAGYLNGDMSQNARNAMMTRFRSGELRYLIATDVAARGIDIEGLSHVFHFAVPTVVETYIHRSGRTGRAGNEGKTITLVTPETDDDFKAIQKQITLTELPFDASSLPERLAPVAAAAAPAPQRGRGRKAEKPAPVREMTSRVPAAASHDEDHELAEEVMIPGLETVAAKGGRPERQSGAQRQPRSSEPRPERRDDRREERHEPRRNDRPEPRRDERERQDRDRQDRNRLDRDSQDRDRQDRNRLDRDSQDRDRQDRDRQGRRRALPPSATNSTRDAANLLNQSASSPRPSTGPLAPLPRHAVNFKKFKLALAPGHRQTRDSLHEWLAKRTGVARSALRSISIYPDHATVEVDIRYSERFLQGLKSGK